MSRRVPPEELQGLYAHALEEYRFTVQLSWKRVEQFLLFNVGVLSAGLAVLQLRLPGIPGKLVAILFAVGIVTCWFGAKAVTRGHRYYREATIHKTLIEDLLGYWEPLPGYPAAAGTMAVTTTRGQKMGKALLADPDAWRRKPLERDSVVFQAVLLLGGIAVADGVGLVASLAL